MSPLQAAKEHCANYDNGACLGMYYNDDLSTDWSRHHPLPRCVLCERGQRCPYFEEYVLPMRISRETNASAQRADALASAVRQYQTSTGIDSARTIKRICPECRRREIGPGKRLCGGCAKKRIRESNRRSQQKIRSKHFDVRKTADSLIRVEPLMPAVRAGSYIESFSTQRPSLAQK